MKYAGKLSMQLALAGLAVVGAVRLAPVASGTVAHRHVKPTPRRTSRVAPVPTARSRAATFLHRTNARKAQVVWAD